MNIYFLQNGVNEQNLYEHSGILRINVNKEKPLPFQINQWLRKKVD